MKRTMHHGQEAIRRAAAMLGALGGKIGGKSRTAKKRRAARINGKLGGRPPKKGNCNVD